MDVCTIIAKNYLGNAGVLARSHEAGAWRRSDRAGTADARYRDHFSSNGLGRDGVVAAEAVAYLHLVKPA